MEATVILPHSMLPHGMNKLIGVLNIPIPSTIKEKDRLEYIQKKMDEIYSCDCDKFQTLIKKGERLMYDVKDGGKIYVMGQSGRRSFLKCKYPDHGEKWSDYYLDKLYDANANETLSQDQHEFIEYMKKRRPEWGESIRYLCDCDKLIRYGEEHGHVDIGLQGDDQFYIPHGSGEKEFLRCRNPAHKRALDTYYWDLTFRNYEKDGIPTDVRERASKNGVLSELEDIVNGYSESNPRVEFPFRRPTEA